MKREFSVTGNTISSHILPLEHKKQNIGSSNKNFNDVYIKKLYLENETISWFLTKILDSSSWEFNSCTYSISFLRLNLKVGKVCLPI